MSELINELTNDPDQQARASQNTQHGVIQVLLVTLSSYAFQFIF